MVQRLAGNASNSNVQLPYGEEMIQAAIPGGRIMDVLRPRPLPEVADFNREVINRLRSPIGSGPLNTIAQGAKRTAIIISDHTRCVPSGLILPILINELESAGIGRNTITVVIGGGNHRAVTEKEKQVLLGPLYGNVDSCHCSDRGYVLKGVTKRGTPVELAKPVAESDLTLAVGSIEMHRMAGFSGGAKAAAVGVASYNALEHNHRLSALQENRPGDLEGNIIRQDMEEFARIAGLGFIVNVVTNEQRKVAAVVAGDPVAAHRAGCTVAERLYSVKVREPADIVIVSPGGIPRDDTVYQAQKALSNALMAAEEGAVIIVTAKCPEGYGDKNFRQWMENAATPEDIMTRARHEFVLGGHKAAVIANAAARTRIFWVSDMDPADVRSLFFEPYSTLQDAVEAAFRVRGDDARVLVMPWGGLTVPCVEH